MTMNSITFNTIMGERDKTMPICKACICRDICTKKCHNYKLVAGEITEDRQEILEIFKDAQSRSRDRKGYNYIGYEKDQKKNQLRSKRFSNYKK